MKREFREKLISALALQMPYSERPKLKPHLNRAAVLAIFGISKTEKLPQILVTQRTEQVDTHKGQMAFPGGMCESHETDEQAALRETEEEVGISPDILEVLGKLPEFATPTGFRIMPVVGLLQTSIEEAHLKLNSSEIAAALWVSTSELKRVYRKELFTVGAVKYPIHVFEVGKYRIWGATGLMIKNMLDRLETLGY